MNESRVREALEWVTTLKDNLELLQQARDLHKGELSWRQMYELIADAALVVTNLGPEYLDGIEQVLGDIELDIEDLESLLDHHDEAFAAKLRKEFDQPDPEDDVFMRILQQEPGTYTATTEMQTLYNGPRKLTFPGKTTYEGK